MTNLRNYILLVGSPTVCFDVDLNEVEQTWEVDWCTFDEFFEHVHKLWELNKENFTKHSGMNFRRFVGMELRLLKDTPGYFKFTIKYQHDKNKLKKLLDDL